MPRQLKTDDDDLSRFPDSVRPRIGMLLNELEAEPDDWIPRSAFRPGGKYHALGLSATTLDGDWERRGRKKDDRRGGGPQQDPVHYRMTYVIRFVRRCWSPRVRSHTNTVTRDSATEA